MSDETIIRAQRERIDELEEENRQLRERLTGERWSPPRCLGLTKTERAILGILMDVAEISTERLRFRLWGDEHRSLPLIHVHVSHVRSKLWPHMLPVKRSHGRGLYLLPEDKARLRAMVAEEQG